MCVLWTLKYVCNVVLEFQAVKEGYVRSTTYAKGNNKWQRDPISTHTTITTAYYYSSVVKHTVFRKRIWYIKCNIALQSKSLVSKSTYKVASTFCYKHACQLFIYRFLNEVVVQLPSELRRSNTLFPCAALLPPFFKKRVPSSKLQAKKFFSFSKVISKSRLPLPGSTLKYLKNSWLIIEALLIKKAISISWE